MKKILLIEDDQNLSDIIKNALSAEYSVTSTQTLAGSFAALENCTFDVALVDRILPDGDALDVIKYLADEHFQTKVIAISRLFKPSEKVRGLESGADDYLPKPFSLGELKLKIRKAINYEKRKSTETFILGDLVFKPGSGEVLIGAEASMLRKKEADILSCLFRYRNQVVSREMIIEEVWNNNDIQPTQTTLDVYIRRIRILLKNYRSIIVTKRGFGYMLTDTWE